MAPSRAPATAFDTRRLATLGRLICLWSLSAVIAGCAVSDAAPAAPGAFHKQCVTFTNGPLTLVGYLYKPDGPGPFPTLIWNHGSEPDPGGGPQFDSVAAIFVPAGYAVLAPVRRGQGDSQGEYIQDAL